MHFLMVESAKDTIKRFFVVREYTLRFSVCTVVQIYIEILELLS